MFLEVRPFIFIMNLLLTFKNICHYGRFEHENTYSYISILVLMTTL